MIPDRPDRVPDGIEPLIGYRAWYFANDLNRASLLPIARGDPSLRSAWDGAHRDWVSATCGFRAVRLPPDPMMRERLEAICSKLGRPLEFYIDRPAHSIPGEDCSCGFYAMKELGAVQEPAEQNVILGCVELAGKVIECTAGYRAERARIAELIPIEGSEGSTKRLALHLGVPLAPAIPPWNLREWLPPAA